MHSFLYKSTAKCSFLNKKRKKGMNIVGLTERNERVEKRKEEVA